MTAHIKTRPARRTLPQAPAMDTVHFSIGHSSLGGVLVARTERGICAVLIGDDTAALQDDLQRRFPNVPVREDGAALSTLVAQVIALVDSPMESFDGPLDIRGTTFQQSVWSALQKIPLGRTATYTEIAARIGQPSAVRAVAAACAANALAIIIPCHRVVRSDGALSGYRWGVERKRTLLQNEGALLGLKV